MPGFLVFVDDICHKAFLTEELLQVPEEDALEFLFSLKMVPFCKITTIASVNSTIEDLLTLGNFVSINTAFISSQVTGKNKSDIIIKRIIKDESTLYEN